jgi:AcrR family transcriptional regulator
MPKPKEKRSYNTTKRSTQSEATKIHILNIAKRLFQESGFDKVTIENIAAESGFSIPTVYSKFKSKRGILSGIIDSALPEETHDMLVNEIYSSTSAKKMLQRIAQLTRKLYEAEQEHMDWAKNATIIDPAFKDLENAKETRRYERQKKALNLIYKQGVICKSLSRTKAKDILWAFTGRDLYRMLVIERNWSANEYETWLGNILVRSLLSPTI